MRSRLLDAAVKVLRQRGYQGFTTIEAVSVAGVSRGAPGHHFKTTDAYLLAALERLFETALARNEEQELSFASADEVLDALLADARRSYFNDDFLTGLDVILAVTRAGGEHLEEVKVLDTRLRHPVEDAWRDRLIAHGVPSEVADTAVWMTFSMVRGAAIRSLVTDDPQRIEAMLASGSAVVRAFIKAPADQPLDTGRRHGRD